MLRVSDVAFWVIVAINVHIIGNAYRFTHIASYYERTKNRKHLLLHGASQGLLCQHRQVVDLRQDQHYAIKTFQKLNMIFEQKSANTKAKGEKSC